MLKLVLNLLQENLLGRNSIFLNETRLEQQNKAPEKISWIATHTMYQYLFNQLMRYQEQPYRIFNAFIYYFGTLSANITTTTLITVNLSIQQYYSVSEVYVSLSSIIYLVVHPFNTFIANYILNKYGFKFGVCFWIIQCSVGAIFVMIGMAIRLMIQINFVFIILGNCVVGIGNTYFIISVTQHSAIWFRPEVRWITTNIGTFFASLSALGAFITPFFILPNQTVKVGRHETFILLLYQGIGVCAVMVLNLIFLRNKPTHPPAPSVTKPREQYLPALKLLLKNKNYIMIFLCSLFAIGAINSFGTIIQPFLHPFGFSNREISYIILMNVFTSLLGIIILSSIIKKVKSIKFFLLFEFGCSIALSIGLALVLYFNNKLGIWINIGLFTFFSASVHSQLLEVAGDVVFPVGQSLSAGFILAGGQLVAFCVGLISAFIVKGQNTKQSLNGQALYFVLYILGFLFLAFISEDFRRRKYDEAGEQTIQILSDSQQNI